MYSKVKSFIKSKIEISNEILEESFQFSEIKVFKKGEVLLNIGEYCHFIGFVNKGLLITGYYDDEGNEKAASFQFENCFITHVESLIDKIKSNVFIKALENCEIIILPKDKLEMLLKTQPLFTELLSKMLLDDFKNMNQKNYEIKNIKPEQRYINLLEREERIIKRVPQKYIASYLGIEPQSLSRLRKRLSL